VIAIQHLVHSGEKQWIQNSMSNLKVLNGELEIFEGIEEELTASDFVFFKFSPITSIEVEKSFSR